VISASRVVSLVQIRRLSFEAKNHRTRNGHLAGALKAKARAKSDVNMDPGLRNEDAKKDVHHQYQEPR
jgi:hypothetical protein